MVQATHPLLTRGVDALRFVPANLRRLEVAGVITSDATALALQLIAKMQMLHCTQVTHAMVDAFQHCTFVDGKPYAGSVGTDPLTYIGALQQLHQFVGFRNHYVESRLEEEGHFTGDPFLHHGDSWSIQTPIVFRFDHERMTHWTTIASTELERALQGYGQLHVNTHP